jgi:peptidoglycan hydrolase CwlO-like protein
MKQSDEYILLIEKKVNQLIELYEKLKSENEDLRNKQEELNQIIKTQSDKIRKLEKRVINLKLAKQLTNNKEAAEAKKKINEMLREIDKCVGLLKK